MRTKNTIANIMGILSILSSASFWILFGLRAFPTLSKLDLTFNQLLVMWIGAIVLALFAALIGSKRWAYVAMLPVINFLFAILVMNLMEWHHP
jgi:hypothetical protein